MSFLRVRDEAFCYQLTAFFHADILRVALKKVLMMYKITKCINQIFRHLIVCLLFE